MRTLLAPIPATGGYPSGLDALMCVCRWSFVYTAHKKCETQINSGHLVTALPLKCNFHGEYNVWQRQVFVASTVFFSLSFIWCLSTVELLFAVRQRRHQTLQRQANGWNEEPSADCELHGRSRSNGSCLGERDKGNCTKNVLRSAQATKSQFEYSNEFAGKRAAGRARTRAHRINLPIIYSLQSDL